MIDSSKLNIDDSQRYSFKEIVEACMRGALIGIEGYPGRTAAGEFTIIATHFNLLGVCPLNLPATNWTHKKSLKNDELRF
jgi:lysyl-tRNA synthetase class II